MSSSKFRDLSAGSKSLIIIEQILFACSLFIAASLNKSYNFVEYQNIPDSFLLLHAVIFALINQLSSLALGLYNSKLRENFRGILQRLILCVVVAFSIVTVLNPLYGTNALPIEMLAISSLLSILWISSFRYFTLKIDFFGISRRRVLVMGAGERASIIERRMRRDVDRQDFIVHGFVVVGGDDQHENGIREETRINLDGSLVNYALEHEVDEIVIASDERRNNLPIDELFAC